MKKRVLVAGGAGFLGSHLCAKLLDEGHEVICLDNFYTGQKANILPLMDNPYFEVVRHDITDPYFARVDEIYNMAAPASPVHYQEDPVQTTKTCVHGSINLLELAKSVGARILLASTSEVYGDPKEHPQKESYLGSVNTIGPRACYDEGKRCAETLFFDYHRQYGVEIKVVRIFNTYGPNMDAFDGRVVSNFIIQALQGKDITLYGNGEQTRSFCYVDDLVDGLVRMMNSAPSVTGPINLGNPNEITMHQLAEAVLKLTSSKSKLSYLPLPQDDPVRRQPCIEKAREILKWAPKTELKDGLVKTIDYFKERI